MAQITKEEVEKIARLSHIELTEQEIINAMKHLEAVLSYAARVQDIAQDIDSPSYAKAKFILNSVEGAGRPTQKNRNIERDDVIIPTDPQPILAQAPEREGDFFVVPVIIESNE